MTTPTIILLRDAYAAKLVTLKPGGTLDQADDLLHFRKGLADRLKRYATVAAKTGFPVVLIAALHWRESSGRFTTYLHNGDPLGKPTVNVPKGVMFREWEPAAIDALRELQLSRGLLGVDANTRLLAPLCALAEQYNGLGYWRKGQPSPYVLAGTTGYKAGKYVRDGVYDPKTTDEQAGCLSMMWAAFQVILPEAKAIAV